MQKANYIRISLKSISDELKKYAEEADSDTLLERDLHWEMVGLFKNGIAKSNTDTYTENRAFDCVKTCEITLTFRDNLQIKLIQNVEDFRKYKGLLSERAKKNLLPVIYSIFDESSIEDMNINIIDTIYLY